MVFDIEFKSNLLMIIQSSFGYLFFNQHRYEVTTRGGMMGFL